MSAEERLRSAYSALRAHDAAGALAALVEVDPGGLLPQEQARVHAYRAQALRALARPEEAARETISAIRLAKQLGDADAVTALRALHTEISASVASLRVAEAGRMADASLRLLPEGGLDTEQLLRKSGAHSDAGEGAEAEAVARLAVVRAVTPREAVLARLALARLTRDPALVLAAHALADAADDQNLITAVAQAARALGVTFAAPSFG